ncbi:AMP-binding protein [Streptomyces sp. NPDC001137]|uniref:AMP-binding protein n=1 Tax=Streptomyces sp. NPDC001137 TaxID=3154378 RepID=UPI0033342E74
MHGLRRNASRLLTDSASRYPERTAIVFGDDRITYEALDAAANRGGEPARLARDPAREQGRAVLPRFSGIYFGILKADTAVVPLNALLQGREVAYHLTDSDAKGVLRLRGHPGAADRKGRLEGIPREGGLHRVLPDRERRRAVVRTRRRSPTPRS